MDVSYASLAGRPPNFAVYRWRSAAPRAPTLVFAEGGPGQSDVSEPAEQHRPGVLFGSEHLLPSRLVHAIVNGLLDDLSQHVGRDRLSLDSPLSVEASAISCLRRRGRQAEGSDLLGCYG